MIRIVILGAGQGKRMGSVDKPKVLFELLGKPMLGYVREAAEASGVDPRPVVVVGFQADQVRAYCGGACDYAEQTERLGTGDAVRRARPLLEGRAEHVLVLYGDQPFVTPETVRRIADAHLASGATLTMGTVTLESFDDWYAAFSDFGRIVRRANGSVERIVEIKDATPEQLEIREVNPSYYCFKAEWMWKKLENLRADNNQGEYYLTDLLAAAIDEGENVETVPVSPEEAIGINSKEQLALVEPLMAERLKKA